MQESETDIKFEKWMDFGINYQKKENYEKAIRAFDKASSIDVSNILPCIEKEKCLRASGKTIEAGELSGIIERMRSLSLISSPFPVHDPYAGIVKMLSGHDLRDRKAVQSMLECHKEALLQVTDDLNKIHLSSSGDKYQNSLKQEAYVLFYYPYYIEPVFIELSKIDEKKYMNSLSHHLSVCIYGCGPAPEYMGVLKYVSNKLKKCRSLSVNFFEMNDWDDIRNKCIESISHNYCDNNQLIITKKNNRLDLLSFHDPKVISQFPEIQSSKMHIFQNCIRDLLSHQDNQNFNAELKDSLFHLFDEVEKGAILIFIELKYNNSGALIRQFQNAIDKTGNVKILHSAFDILTNYSPNFTKPEQIQDYFDKEIRMKRRVGYISLIAIKI